jgi:hypothetical protein
MFLIFTIKIRKYEFWDFVVTVFEKVIEVILFFRPLIDLCQPKMAPSLTRLLQVIYSIGQLMN